MFDKLRNNSRIVVYIVVAAFVITGAFMGYGAYMGGGQNPNTNRASSAIAEVNGEEISYQEFLNVLSNNAQQASQLSSTQLLDFRLNILNSIIERRLVLQKADELGISTQVSDEEVNNYLDDFLNENNLTEEELKQNLEEQDFTLNDLKNDLRNNLRTQKIIEETIQTSYENVEVSEEEIKKEYEKQAENNEEIADYSDKKEEIKNNLLENKQSEAFNEWLENLKANANIVINDNSLKGVKAFNDENYDMALDSFQKAQEESESPATYIYLARTYMQKENSDKAIDTYEKAIENYPENWEIRYNFAEVYAEIEQIDLAKAEYEKAAEYASPSDIMAHYSLYQGFTKIGEEEKAQEEMNTIIEMQQQMNQSSEESNSTLNPEDSSTSNNNDLDNEDLDNEDLEIETVPAD